MSLYFTSLNNSATFGATLETTPPERRLRAYRSCQQLPWSWIKFPIVPSWQFLSCWLKVATVVPSFLMRSSASWDELLNSNGSFHFQLTQRQLGFGYLNELTSGGVLISIHVSQFSACRLRVLDFQRDQPQPPASLNGRLMLSKIRRQHGHGFENLLRQSL